MAGLSGMMIDPHELLELFSVYVPSVGRIQVQLVISQTHFA